MKKYLPWILSSLLLISSGFGAERSPIVTIYNSDLGLIQEQRTLSVQAGRQTISITDVAAKIQPATVHLDAGEPRAFHLQEQNFQYDLVSTGKVFDKYIGNPISLVTENDESRSGQLLARDGSSLMLRKEDGSLLIINAEKVKEYNFPSLPQGLILRPTLQWIIDAEQAGEYPVRLSYLTEGLTWNAEYILKLRQGDESGTLSSWVTLENSSGAAYSDATVKLVAGDIHRAQEEARARVAREMALARAEAEPAVREREIFEYHLYEIGFPTTLEQNSMKQVTFRNPTEIDYQRVYTFEHRERQTTEQENVNVEITFQNSTQNNLGVPLPTGVVRLMQEDADGSEVLVGEDRIRHTPRDEEVRLTAGKSFDVVGDREISEYERRGNDFERWTVRITLRNHKDSAVTVAVIDHYYGDWEVLRESLQSVREDAGTLRYEVEIPGQGESEVQYTVERHL
ncbi:MAG TPA: hypothetical protein VKA68_11805 [bacterium]|nr:hypothetical protein [bacterium]